MSRTMFRTAAVGALALASLAVAVPGASAGGPDGRVEAQGSCSGSSDWKLTAKPDDGRIEVEYEVDSNVTGQTWQVRISDQGAVVFAGSAVTRGPSGSFSVERKVPDRAGTDRFLAQARNAATGETCSGRVDL